VTDTPFDTVIVADWSASAAPSPAKPSANAIWIGVADGGGTGASYHRTRAEAAALLRGLLDARAGRRVLVGFDFPFGYPAGFAERLTGRPGAQAVWDWLAAHVADDAMNRNTRFHLADAINARLGPAGPFWGRPRSLALPHLPETKAVDYPALGLAERRRVETLVPRAQPVWKLYTTGSVGSQAMMGLPLIAGLARRPGTAVWPFAPTDAPVVLAEVYPSLIDPAVRAMRNQIKDEAQVRLLAQSLWRLARDGMLDVIMADVPDWPGRGDEGWILGAGHAEALIGACG
jgi:molybdopterin-guanine dinucleotide biosynthesis adapter protein